MMMEKLNSASSHLIIKIVFVVIIVSFLLGGMSSYLGFTSSPYVAKVNGQKIDQQQFDARLQSVLGQQDFSTMSETQKEQKTTEIKQALLNSEINTILLSDYTHKSGFYIPDSVVQQKILSIPTFQVDGKFDNSTFNLVLSSNGLNAAAYAEMVRNSLEQSSLFDSILESNFALPVDSNISLLRNQEREVSIGTLAADKVKVDKTVTSQDIQQYYSANQTKWSHPEQLKVSYIQLNEANYTTPANVTSKEIQDYYNAHKSSYTSVARDLYSAIIVSTQTEADALLKQLKAGADFTQLSEKNSIYPFLKDKKGQLGWFDSGKAPQQIIDAKLTTKNPLSAVISYDGGYAIFKLDKSEPATTKSLSSVTDEIKQLLTKQQQDKQFIALQEKIQQAIGNKDTIDQLASLANAKVAKTDWISLGDLPQQLDNNAAKQAIFSSGLFDQAGPVDMTSDVVTNDNSAFVFKVTQYRAAGVLPLTDVESQVKADIIQQRTEAALQKEAKAIVADLTKGNSTLAKQNAVSFNKNYSLTQSSKELSTADINAIFAAGRPVNNQPVYGYVVNDSNSATLFELTAVKDASKTSDLSDEMAYRYAYLDGKMLQDSLKQAASIKINQTSD